MRFSQTRAWRKSRLEKLGQAVEEQELEKTWLNLSTVTGQNQHDVGLCRGWLSRLSQQQAAADNHTKNNQLADERSGKWIATSHQFAGCLVD
jgi:hypothetical protein